MPQINSFLPGVNPSNQPKPVAVDSNGYIIESGGSATRLNITAATVIKNTPGRVATVTVVVAGSAAGTINDCATTGAVAAANLVATTPNAVNVISLRNWPFLTGITVTPGTGQTLAISYT